MSDFRKLTESVFASPQICIDDITAAAALGVTLVINNRPDGEAEDQTPGTEIEAAAQTAGMEYIAIPMTMPTLSDAHVTAMAQALSGASGPVLTYCRSGTRSTLLWSLVQARGGGNPDTIAATAAQAGYDVAPVRSAMDAYAAQAG